MKCSFLSVLLLTLTLLFPGTRAQAAWPTNGTAVCKWVVRDQLSPEVTTDGVGGWIVTWQDRRNSSNSRDIYAQRINAMGSTLWPSSGVAVCVAADYQEQPMITSDGAGGAIIIWLDRRSGTNYDIYAQRIDSAGNLLWTANGVPLCTQASNEYGATIVSDGAGGAIAAWSDLRNGAEDIFVQRIDPAGNVLWTSDGVALCTATSFQDAVGIVSDGASGAIVSWEDFRSGGYNIYARRINAAGTALWSADGVALSTAGVGYDPAIVSDGAGGAIVTWGDARPAGPNDDIYAQRIDTAGNVLWTANGVALCAESHHQQNPKVASDGAGGAIVTWRDDRNVYADIYAQRVNASGTALWAIDGITVCTAIVNQSYPTIISDGSSGAIVTWMDNRNDSYTDIYAQRVDGAGNSLWSADGVALCTEDYDQKSQTIVSDGAGGAVVVWQDNRDTSFGSDIYAQRIGAAGAIPTGVENTPSIARHIVVQSSPNPFSDATEIELALPSASRVEIDVFDVQGRRVAHEVIAGTKGWQHMQWDGRDGVGRQLSSGVYLYRVKAAGETVTRKMVIAR